MEIKLQLNRKGNPVIKIKHLDKCNNIEQEVLRHFISNSKNGLTLKHISSFLECGTDNSFEIYEITPNE